MSYRRQRGGRRRRSRRRALRRVLVVRAVQVVQAHVAVAEVVLAVQVVQAARRRCRARVTSRLLWLLRRRPAVTRDTLNRASAVSHRAVERALRRLLSARRARGDDRVRAQRVCAAFRTVRFMLLCYLHSTRGIPTGAVTLFAVVVDRVELIETPRSRCRRRTRRREGAAREPPLGLALAVSHRAFENELRCLLARRVRVDHRV